MSGFNLPPGVSDSMIPGYYDIDVPYVAWTTVYYSSDDIEELDNLELSELVAQSMQHRDFTITVDPLTVVVETWRNGYAEYHVDVKIEGDYCIDERYMDDVEDEIKSYILNEYIAFDLRDVEVEVMI